MRVKYLRHSSHGYPTYGASRIPQMYNSIPNTTEVPPRILILWLAAEYLGRSLYQIKRRFRGMYQTSVPTLMSFPGLAALDKNNYFLICSYILNHGCDIFLNANIIHLFHYYMQFEDIKHVVHHIFVSIRDPGCLL